MMYKTILFFSVVINFLSSCYRQEPNYILYNSNIEEVNYLLFKADSLKAEELLTKEVFNIKRPFLRDLRDLVKLRLQLGMYDKLDNLVENSFRFGMSKEYLLCDTLISNYYASIWNERFPTYSRARGRYISKLDTVYRNTIIKLINEDQKYRTLAKEKGRHIDSLRKANDAMVLVRLKELIAEKGYFGFSKIGEDILWGGNCFNFTDVFFRHVEPDSNRLYFYPVLLDAVANGELYALSYAAIVDYDWIKSDTFSSLFGTVVFSFKGEQYKFPLRNFDQIDSLRSSIGLIDWERNLEMTSSNYDPTLKPWEW